MKSMFPKVMKRIRIILLIAVLICILLLTSCAYKGASSKEGTEDEHKSESTQRPDTGQDTENQEGEMQKGDDGDKGREQDSDTVIYGKGSLIIPLKEMQFISRGYDPESHPYIDIVAKKGTEVLSSLDGQVTGVDYVNTDGNYVIVWSEGDMMIMYSHLDSCIVKPGDVVKQGDVLGYVGQTGEATGPVLSFRVIRKGKHIDPMSLLQDMK